MYDNGLENLPIEEDANQPENLCIPKKRERKISSRDQKIKIIIIKLGNKKKTQKFWRWLAKPKMLSQILHFSQSFP